MLSVPLGSESLETVEKSEGACSKIRLIEQIEKKRRSFGNLEIFPCSTQFQLGSDQGKLRYVENSDFEISARGFLTKMNFVFNPERPGKENENRMTTPSHRSEVIGGEKMSSYRRRIRFLPVDAEKIKALKND